MRELADAIRDAWNRNKYLTSWRIATLPFLLAAKCLFVGMVFVAFAFEEERDEAMRIWNRWPL